MRSLILLLAYAASATAQWNVAAWPTGPRILSVMGDESKPIAVDAMRAMKLTTADAKFISWEVDPVYELGKDANGQPVLVSGDIGVKLVVKAGEIGLKEPGQDPVFKEIGPGEVIIWGKTPGKVRLVARGVIGDVNQRIATLVIEVTGARPPPKPVDPPAPGDPPATSLYFLIVGPDGPTPPAVLESLKLTAWDEVKKKAGVKYLPLSEVPTQSGQSPLPPGTTLPCVLKLSQGPATSTIIPPPLALPMTNEAVKKLLEAK